MIQNNVAEIADLPWQPAQAIVRPGRVEDSTACGTIAYEAFKTIAEAHAFPPDFPSPEVAIGLMEMLFSHDRIYSVVAEQDGRVVGSNFLWEMDAIAAVGPITVDPDVQNHTLGRQLMDAVLERARAQRCAGVRLVQAAYHNRSLSLYAKLGFDAREPLSAMQGSPLGLTMPGYSVRPATKQDIEACNRLCQQVHGYHRGAELRDAIDHSTASVVEHNGRISGYTTAVGFLGHSVCESDQDLKALIGAATEFAGPGFLLPTRNTDLLRWCLDNGLRVVQPMTLMSLGLYNEPDGAFLPSVLC